MTWLADLENPWPEQTGCCPLPGRPYSVSEGSRNVAAASTPENALLIAAAPDLLRALQAADHWVAQYLDRPGHDAAARCMIDVIRSALAKAEGRP